jgi:alkaline phosphatase D
MTTPLIRDTLGPDMGSANRYLPNEEGDILGEEQWQWFENVLRNSKADFHIVGSSIQVIAEEQGYEKWSNFPKSRDRLFELLSTINPKPLLIISGDRHIAEISKIDITGLDYPLYDFTASGLTHTWGMAWNEPNKYRVDSLIVSKNFGLIKLDWEKANPAVTLEVRDDFDKLIQKMKIDY